MHEKARVSNNKKKRKQIWHKSSQYTKTAQLQLKLTNCMWLQAQRRFTNGRAKNF